jgi:hypothetical protein
MLYLADQYDKDHKISFEHGTGDYYEMMSWLMFQMVAAPSKLINQLLTQYPGRHWSNARYTPS